MTPHGISSQPDRPEKSQTTVAAPDLAILLVHTGQSSSLIGQNAEADTVPACLLEMNHRVYRCLLNSCTVHVCTGNQLA